MNLRPPACKADALPLSYPPNLETSYYLQVQSLVKLFEFLLTVFRLKGRFTLPPDQVREKLNPLLHPPSRLQRDY